MAIAMPTVQSPPKPQESAVARGGQGERDLLEMGALPPETVLARLATTEKGLNDEAVEERLGRYGHNEVERARKLGFIGEMFSSALLAGGAAVPDGHYEEQTMRLTVVPFRNAIMLSIAAGWAESTGAEGLVIAAHGGDHAIYPDCREEFLGAMGEAMRTGTYAQVRLLRPFIAIDKAGIAAEGARLGVDYSRTWSCYKGGEVHCGRCGTCVERREAFIKAGLPDPTVYASLDPLPPRPPRSC